MNKRIHDAAHRQAALNPQQSFIIQAPAGSGKTELLTQRFLKLLSMVDRPERVLAITFTRKATQEMRQRILQRIEQAADTAATPPLAEHERIAVKFAAQVLEKDQRLGWNLQRNPARLQIYTIDGLCARIAGLLPSTGEGVSGLRVIEDARPLYHKAARRLIEDIGSGKIAKFVYPALTRLLVHLQGDADRLQTLLSEMLGRRDQWLTLLEYSGSELNQVLQQRQRVELDCLFGTLGQAQLASLMEHLLALTAGANDLELANELRGVIDASEHAPENTDLQVQAVWLMLGAVATKAGNPFALRSINGKVLAGGGGADRDQHVQAIKAIVETWLGNDLALMVFQRFAHSPPLGLSAGQEEILTDCIVLLQVAQVELRLLFAEQGQADFQYLAEMAMNALGPAERPGDALLYEDYRLSHILMDEFQDTSHTQFKLLHRLTSGWQAGDGRSLFLVGDPMQSIYRFREADVALFKQVFASGKLGEIQLERLRLSSNFRSTSELISWFNAQFAGIFKQGIAVSPGAIEYAHVVAERGPGGQVVAHSWPQAMGDAHEAALVADLLVRKQVERADISVAIMGRSRNHLADIATELKQRGIAFEAVNVEKLASRPVIQDLLALLRAILHPADRIAWLALLRAPWLGLAVPELHAFAADSGREDILSLMLSPDRLIDLNEALAEQVRATGEIMQQVVAARDRVALHRLVEVAWIRLKGPYIVGSQAELENAQSFFRLLAEAEAEQPDDVLAAVLSAMEEFYSGSVTSKVQLMTIHAAKGLEFDLVILPGLHKRGGSSKSDFLRIEQLQFDAGGSGVLMAPLKARDDQQPGLYNYLYKLNSEQAAFEEQRVLYVAATRAKQELHLFGAWKLMGSAANKAPGCERGTFMKMLWPVFTAVIDPDVAPDDETQTQEPPLLPFLRLENAPQLVIKPAVEPRQVFAEELRIPDCDALALGSAVHLWLELLHDHAPAPWNEAWLVEREPALAASLANAGARQENLDVLRRRLQQVLNRVMTDPHGQEIILPGGKMASWAELAFYSRDKMQLKKHIIDRIYQRSDGSFVIVDYKTGQDQDEVRQKWQAQLERYGSIIANYSGKPVSALQVLQVETGELIDFNPKARR